MSSTELTSVPSEPSAPNAVFSEQTKRDVMLIISRANGGITQALMAPVKDLVAWLGIRLDTSEDWARIVSARAEIRKLVNAQVRQDSTRGPNVIPVDF
jgi:hypothetical protein